MTEKSIHIECGELQCGKKLVLTFFNKFNKYFNFQSCFLNKLLSCFIVMVHAKKFDARNVENYKQNMLAFTCAHYA